MKSNPNGVRGVLLAGGSGSRLLPLTRTTNKHLLPVGQVPMIYNPVGTLVGAGITEILVVTGVEHMGDIVNQLRSGRELGCRFTYKVQEAAAGIADALALAADFIGQRRAVVALGDNIFQDPLGPHLDAYLASGKQAGIMLKEVPDPERFGCPRIEGDRVVEIIEKPAIPPSRLAVTGLYFYGPEVFEIISTLTPSARGELEITDVNNRYLDRGQLHHGLLSGYWTDAGTHESMARANRLVMGGERG